MKIQNKSVVIFGNLGMFALTAAKNLPSLIDRWEIVG